MKKKIFLFVILLVFICGCSRNNNTKDNYSSEEIEDVIVDSYKDENFTPIGIYKLNGNNLIRLDKINITPVIEEEIGTFQLYPSNEKSINLDKAFGLSFYDEWVKYNNIRMGFNIKFSLNNGEEISYNILSPENTFDKWEYLMNYLYDDYANYGKSFYSHIENNQYTDKTLFTAIKLQSSYSISDINSKIQLTVFTYDSDDDFLDDEYRGNSYHTLDICLEGRPC